MNSAKWQTLKLRKGPPPFFGTASLQASGYKCCKLLQGLSLCHEHPYKKHLLSNTSMIPWSLPKPVPRRNSYSVGPRWRAVWWADPNLGENCRRKQVVRWDHESWRIQGFFIHQTTLGWQHFLQFFCTLVNAKEMMPDFDLEFEVDRHYLCEVGHMSHVFFGMCVATQSQHEPQVLLKSGGQSPAPWGTHRMSSFRNIQFQWMASSLESCSKHGSLLSLRSNRPPISPQRLGLATGKIPAFGMAFISFSCQAKTWYWHYTCDSSVRHCRGRTMICIGGRGAKGMNAYIYTKKVYIHYIRYKKILDIIWYCIILILIAGFFDLSRSIIMTAHEMKRIPDHRWFPNGLWQSSPIILLMDHFIQTISREWK